MGIRINLKKSVSSFRDRLFANLQFPFSFLRLFFFQDLNFVVDVHCRVSELQSEDRLKCRNERGSHFYKFALLHKLSYLS